MKKPLVLVVDDNPQYAKLFDLLSDSLNITAHVVTCCTDAAELLKQHDFDLVLMDWVMPEEDGPQCTARIRQWEKKSGKRIPIIGVSGYVQATMEKCIEADMDDFLSIPFTLEDLQAKIAYWLRNGKERRTH